MQAKWTFFFWCKFFSSLAALIAESDSFNILVSKSYIGKWDVILKEFMNFTF